MKITDVICCPKCKSELRTKIKKLHCSMCNLSFPIKDGIIHTISNNPEHQMSIQKWDKYYQGMLQADNLDEFRLKYKSHFDLISKQLNDAKTIDGLVYLEIGCGPFLMGADLAGKCKLVIGIDFCPTALKIARMNLEARGVKNFILIQGDILNMPIKNNICDLIYGGGVIEHFKETKACIRELYRITKKDGAVFNSVPYLNLSALTYRQIWGNIPNLPIIREIAETLHIKLLKGKHMVFGYEYSFTGHTLVRLHRKIGFRQVKVSMFEIPLELEFIPKLFLRQARWLATNSYLFCPMIKVVGYK